jgi:hypothetical protein
MTSMVHHSTEPTLRKMGAHIRWLMNSAGVDPEGATVVIAVRNNEEQSLMISKLLREFDGRCMTRHDKFPQTVIVHGVPITIIVKQRKQEA